MSRILAVLFAGSLFLLPSLSSAFDGDRRGFIMGIGLGAHVVDAEIERDDNHAGLSSSFRLGMGVSDRVLLYFLDNHSWYNRDGYTLSYGLTAFGASFYLTRSLPAFYLTAAYGHTGYNDFKRDQTLFDNDDDFIDEGEGNGFMLGAGLELRKHLNLEAVVYQSDIEPDLFANEFVVTTFQIYLNLLFY